MNRNDRKIALGVVVVAVVALTGLFLTGDDESASVQQAVSSTPVRKEKGSAAQRSVHYDIPPTHQPERFTFDPNTADSTQLLRLGLQPWQVRNIYRYRAKGGIYRKKSDFARLYGLTVKQYRELEPYIRISDDYLPASTLVGAREQVERDTIRYPVKIQEDEHIVLNTADTTQLRKVPGIGAYYAREIVRHGQWLGGYVSVDQLDEIDGFPQESKKYFVVRQPHPKKLNINRLTLEQLRRHPYINYYQAKAIVDYRRLRGDITSLEDLRLIKDFPPETLKRLEPYIEY